VEVEPADEDTAGVRLESGRVREGVSWREGIWVRKELGLHVGSLFLSPPRHDL
jgi:hypothetical protein